MSGVPCAQRSGPCTHDVPHGSHSTYTNHGCRCDACRAANVQFNASARLRRREEMQVGVVSPPHGVESTYFNYMCRCDECRAEHARRDRERRARRRGVLKTLAGLVLVGGCVFAAAVHDQPETPERVTWICTPTKPRCISLMNEAVDQ